MAYQNKWSDWMREFIGISPGGLPQILDILATRYIEAMRHVARYTQHAEKMAYPQFREKLLAIAADEARHAEWLADKIVLLGGTVPAVPAPGDGGKNSWQYLMAALDEEKRSSAKLIAELQTVREELPDIAAGLERIYEDGEKHRAAIRDMLMRSDPQARQSG